MLPSLKITVGSDDYSYFAERAHDPLEGNQIALAECRVGTDYIVQQPSADTILHVSAHKRNLHDHAAVRHKLIEQVDRDRILPNLNGLADAVLNMQIDAVGVTRR